MRGVIGLQDGMTQDVFLSRETKELQGPIRRLLVVGWELGIPTSVTEGVYGPEGDVLAKRFQHHAEAWRKECAHLSSVREMALHESYQQIVGMGPGALSYILAELKRRPDHWFWALRAITGEDPVQPEHKGDLAQMAQDWLGWAERRGIYRER